MPYFYKPTVNAILLKQCFMCPLLDNMPVIQNDNLVGILDCGKPVGNDNQRFATC